MNIITTARESARLEYLNSQEPGDASQASAIDIVDRLLEEDDIETCQKISIDQISGTKSVSTLGSKVAQCLAKRVDCSYQLEKAGVFDWFDTPNNGDCITSNISREKPRVHANNRMPYLDSQRCGGYGSGTRAGAILEYIDENSAINCLKKPEPAGATDDLYEAYDIGPNTQMAAEAMEALFNASTVSYDVSDNGHSGSSLGNESKENNLCSLNSPIQKQKLACLPQSSGGMPTRFKQSKVDDTKRPNDESSIHSTNCCSKSKPRKNPKQMIRKAKRSMVNGVLKGAINHEVLEPIVESGANDSNISYLLGMDDVIHPKRKRTCMFTSGSSKVEFSKDTISTAARAETTESTESPIAKIVSISDPDAIGSTKMTHQSCLAAHEASTANSTNDFDGTTATRSKVRVIQKETSHSSRLERTLIAGLENQSSSKQNAHRSSLTSRVPLRETNGTGPQSRTHTPKKPLKKGLLKSPGSRELASLFGKQVPEVLQSGRRRKSMSTVRVLFSQNMDSETIKDQMKILIHFGLQAATTISEATHFVAEKFTRTRNMLEAIAMGIPVVTPLWLECCGEARCFIDEKKYIVRDSKKEKALGFSMPISLSQACKKPLLEGKRVLITPNAKPSKEILQSLVVAARGKPLEKITPSMMKNKNFEGAFVISCEQDCSICLPLIKNGLEVFDSELVLNGIVTQKLEYERYRLFRDKTMRLPQDLG